MFSDFDHYEKESTKMRDWRFFNLEADWTEIRMKYTEDREITHSFTRLPLFHCPEFVIQPDDISARIRVFESVCSLYFNLFNFSEEKSIGFGQKIWSSEKRVSSVCVEPRLVVSRPFSEKFGVCLTLSFVC